MLESVTCRARVGARYRLPADPVLLAHAGVVVLAVGVLLHGVGTPLTLGRLSWSASVIFDTTAMLTARRIVRLLPAGDPARRFWRAYGFAALAVGIGYLVQLIVTAHGPVPPALMLGGPVTAALLGVAALTVVIVMCTYPLQISSRRGRACFWLDMATVMVGAALGAELLVVLTGPVMMLVAVFAVAKLLIAGQPPFTVAAGLLGAGAPATGGLIAGPGPGLLAQGHANWFFAISAFGDACLMLAAVVQRRQVGADPGTLRRTPAPAVQHAALPCAGRELHPADRRAVRPRP
ncbi:MAG: hypothetical protein E6F99_04440 [Actinobacteria bacterium]|nr:MAG: hypothetical protein E6F99_04440 [Actinomycetota bacterium]